MREHKTAHVTGRPRIIHLSPVALNLCKRLANLRPDGLLFVNTKGRPWNNLNMRCQIRKLQIRTGLGSALVCYSFRHLFATDALERGASVAAVAELLGHRSPAMLAKHYSHLVDRTDYLKDTLLSVRGVGVGGAGAVPEPAAPAPEPASSGKRRRRSAASYSRTR